MNSPSEAERLERDLSELVSMESITPVAIQWASPYILRTSMEMLRAQILSRRAMIGTGELTQEAVYRTAREIQRRVERIRLIVAELRRRGVEVEWEE